MKKEMLAVMIGLFFGLFIGWFIVVGQSESALSDIKNDIIDSNNKAIGFLPFWLLDRARTDYSPYLTTLTYFSLTLDIDGSILKQSNPQESEPGWYTLTSGKANKFLERAKEKDVRLSIAVFMAGEEGIGKLLENPEENANNLLKDIVPIMKKYDFTDLNLDIESVNEASSAAQLSFIKFTKTLKKGLDEIDIGTLSIDISPTAFIKPYLINPEGVEPYIDEMIIMGYDYHWPGSSVTGPVAPLGGGDTISEFDTITAVRAAKTTIPSHKLILGIPLYGYEWETLDDFPRAATIKSTGIVASGERIEELLKRCGNCQIGLEEESEESYVVYFDKESNTYHQIFYPNKLSTEKKIKLIKEEKFDGIALWALGYEDTTILEPLRDYILNN